MKIAGAGWLPKPATRPRLTNRRRPHGEELARLNEQLAYGYDAAGNLAFRTNNALVQNFMVNNLNELTTNTNGGTLTVVGSTATFAASVIVNGTNSADLYHDGTFAAPNMPLTTNYTAVAEDSYFRYATNTITVDLSTNVAFQYDANGNLTNDGLRSFAYDDENQLVSVWVTNQWMSQFTYDAKMRRRIRQEFTWNGSGWTQTSAVYYVYDGNLVVQERDVNNLPTTTYTRGKDLSGSLEGVGGIGGLLARTSQQYADAPLTGHSYYHADGNGNVTMLINNSQTIVAKYLYDSFGNVLSKSGLLADANVYQFSSKEKDLNSGLLYYLYRFYEPNLQRWLSRDPMAEPGFETSRELDFEGGPAGIRRPATIDTEGAEYPYEMVKNDPIDLYDPEGLIWIPGPHPNGPGSGQPGGTLWGGSVSAPGTQGCNNICQVFKLSHKNPRQIDYAGLNFCVNIAKARFIKASKAGNQQGMDNACTLMAKCAMKYL